MHSSLFCLLLLLRHCPQYQTSFMHACSTLMMLKFPFALTFQTIVYIVVHSPGQTLCRGKVALPIVYVVGHCLLSTALHTAICFVLGPCLRSKLQNPRRKPSECLQFRLRFTQRANHGQAISSSVIPEKLSHSLLSTNCLPKLSSSVFLVPSTWQKQLACSISDFKEVLVDSTS